VQNLEPARLSLYVQLGAAIIVAVGLDRTRAYGWRRASAPTGRGQPAPADSLVPVAVPATGQGPAPPGDAAGPGGMPEPGDPGRGGRGADPPGWVRPVVVAAVGLVALLPLMPKLPIHTYPVQPPRFFTGTKVREVPPGALVLAFPFELAPHNDAMMWQAASGMRFRLLGGDVFVPGPGGRSTWHPLPPGPPVLAAVLEAGQYGQHPYTPPPPMTASAVAAIRALCARSGVSVVFVDRKAQYGYAFDVLVRRALGVPGRVEGRMSVWLNVQRDLRRHPA
jgi:hypothetical protein